MISLWNINPFFQFQILDVNGHNFEHMTKVKALEILKGTTHLSITVKYNTLGKYAK